MEISKSSQEFYEKTYPLLRESHIEVWEINGRYIIADGHNQAFYDLTKRNQTSIAVRVINPEDCGVGEEVYREILEELVRRANSIKKQGIRTIKDLKLKD